MNEAANFNNRPDGEQNDDRVSGIINWLVTEGPRLATLSELLDGFCRRLREIELPVDRATMGVPLLHPTAQSSYVAWNPADGAEQSWYVWTKESMGRLRASPIYIVYNEGKDVAVDLSDEDDRSRFPVGKDLWEEGFQEYHAIAIPFSDGTSKVFTAATRQKNGFSSSELEQIKRALPALAVVFEGFVARKTAETLMETYVGKRAGLQVLDGQIARGDGSDIEAVIWFSDLRRFTELAAELPEAQMLELLNTYFTIVSEAIEENGGEVLKYIGDAVLAIFPDDGNMSNAVAKAEKAAFAALDKHQEEDRAFQYGVALHPGRVFYGNIGGGSRLDFTVIGQAVNLASRIESLCSALDEKLLVSADLKRLSNLEWNPRGSHNLKGVDQPVEVFGLPES